MSEPTVDIHFTSFNRPNGLVQLSWDEHRVDMLDEEEAKRLALEVMFDQFDPANWRGRYSRTIVPFRPRASTTPFYKRESRT